ncbi:MAG: hypothetical protein ACLPVI_00840 [Dehalococcoidales bacterium]
MSINAYHVIDIKLGNVSFNLYRDRNLSDFLDNEIQFYGSIHDGIGMIDIPVKILKKALRQSTKLNLDEKTMNHLQSDIAAAKSSKDEVVTYYCF